MDAQKEQQLIDRARNSSFTEDQLVTFFDNVSERGGSQAVLDAIKLRMRVDFPRAAKKKFGAKTHEVVELLTRLSEEVAGMFELSDNKVENHVKTGGDEQTGKQYIYRYISYKNADNVGAQLSLTQMTAESEVLARVDHYQTNAKEENFRHPQTFPLTEFGKAADLYKEYLAQLGTRRKAVA